METFLVLSAREEHYSTAVFPLFSVVLSYLISSVITLTENPRLKADKYLVQDKDFPFGVHNIFHLSVSNSFGFVCLYFLLPGTAIILFSFSLLCNNEVKLNTNQISTQTSYCKGSTKIDLLYDRL